MDTKVNKAKSLSPDTDCLEGSQRANRTSVMQQGNLLHRMQLVHREEMNLTLQEKSELA